MWLIQIKSRWHSQRRKAAKAANSQLRMPNSRVNPSRSLATPAAWPVIVALTGLGQNAADGAHPSKR